VGARRRRLARLALDPRFVFADLPLLAIEPFLFLTYRFLRAQDFLQPLFLADVEIRTELKNIDDARWCGERSAEDKADLGHGSLDLVVAGIENHRPVAVEGE